MSVPIFWTWAGWEPLQFYRRLGGFYEPPAICWESSLGKQQISAWQRHGQAWTASLPVLQTDLVAEWEYMAAGS